MSLQIPHEGQDQHDGTGTPVPREGDSAQLQLALARLPHGPDFRFVERLLELEPGKRGVGEYTLRGDEAFLRGHFPGDPLMPGVLLIEAAAQLAGIVAQSDPVIPPLDKLKLTSVRGAKISGSARVGERLRIEVTILGRMGPLVHAAAQGSVGGTTVLQVELTLSGVLPAGWPGE